jgi:hypothetical protein
MALGSTQSLTEMSTRNLPGGKGQPAAKADKLTAICEQIIWTKCWSLDVSQHYGLPRPVKGIVLPLPLPITYYRNICFLCLYFRYLVASRDLRPGEIIMTVDPLVVGPPHGCQPLCLGCYKKLDLQQNAYRLVTSVSSLCSVNSVKSISVHT